MPSRQNLKEFFGWPPFLHAILFWLAPPFKAIFLTCHPSISHQLAPEENLNCSLSEWSKRVRIFTSASQKPYYWLPLSHWMPLHNWLNNNQSISYCFRASKRYTVTQYGRVGNFRAAWIFFRYHFLHFISKSSLVQIYSWTSSPNTFLTVSLRLKLQMVI